MPNDPLPPADLAQAPLSPYVYMVAFSCTLLAVSYALGQLRFGQQPGLGYDYMGRLGANLAHSFLSFLRPASVALAVIGLVGLCGDLARRPPEKTLALALLAGAVILVAAYWVPAALSRLDARALRLPPTEGQLCLVIEAIPARGKGLGKVRARIGSRTANFLAESTGPEFGEGIRVRILNVLEDGHVEVGPEVP